MHDTPRAYPWEFVFISFLDVYPSPPPGAPDRPLIRCFEYNFKKAKLISLQ